MKVVVTTKFKLENYDGDGNERTLLLDTKCNYIHLQGSVETVFNSVYFSLPPKLVSGS